MSLDISQLNKSTQVKKQGQEVLHPLHSTDDEKITQEVIVNTDKNPSETAKLEAEATSAQLQSTTQNSSVLNEQQELLLGRLKLKIEEKQKEFDDLKTSGKLSTEELMDFDRARARMMRPFDLAQSEILRQHHEQFSNYTNNLLDNILQLDAKQLNMLLACTHIRGTKRFESTFNYGSDYNSLSEVEKIDKLLPDFVNGDFKYLTDSPVVVRLSKQPESHLFEFSDEECKSREGGLNKEDIEKIEEAFKLISQIKLRERKTNLFSSTESLVIVNECVACGLAGSTHMPIINVDDHRTATEILSTLVHEDQHQIQHNSDLRYKRIFKFELECDDVKKVNSPWGQKTPIGILSELEAYNSGDNAALDVFEKVGFDPEKDFPLLEKSIHHVLNKVKAIKILRDNRRMMNGDGISWFNEQLDECKKLDVRLSAFIKERIVKYLNSSESNHRLKAFEGIDEACQKLIYCGDLHEFCLQKIKTEETPYVLTALLSQSNISNKLRETATKKFNTDDFKNILLSKIDSCLSDGEYRHVGYSYISDGYEFSDSEDRKKSFAELFKQKIIQETNLEFFQKLETPSVHEDLKPLIEERKSELTGTS